MSNYRLNWPVFILGNFFGLLETSYFGWNALPASPEEVICDGITILICAMAITRKESPR